MRSAERLVVDTNTIVSGILLPQSVPGKLLVHAVEHCRLIFSPATRDELLEVMTRHKFDRYVPFEMRERSATILLRDSELVAPGRRFALCRDPKDDKFLDAAHAGHAAIIVSGDSDLRALVAVEGVVVRSAAQYMASVAP